MSYSTYKEYAQSGHSHIGAIPSHWDVLRAKFLFRRENRPPRDKDEIVTAFRDGQVTLRSNRRTDGFTVALKEIGYQGVRKGDFIIHAMDGFAGAIGISDSDGKSSPVYSVCTPSNPDVVPAYYALYLRTLALNGFIESLAKGVRERSTEFRFAEFKEVLFPIPPRKEQFQITTFLDREIAKIDRLIEKQQRLIDLIEEKRIALVDQAIQHRLTFEQRLTHSVEQILRPVRIISDVEYTALGIYNRGRGIFHKPDTQGSDIGESDFFWVEQGDLIISGQFAWEGSVALASSNENGCIVSHRYVVLRGRDNVMETTYLWAYLMTKAGDFLLNECSRGAAGRNKPLSLKLLMKEKIPTPPIAEQQKVSSIIEQEVKIRALVARQKKLLNERRSALISAAVTGKIDVRDQVQQDDEKAFAS